jgi:hypothetical protein
VTARERGAAKDIAISGILRTADLRLFVRVRPRRPCDAGLLSRQDGRTAPARSAERDSNQPQLCAARAQMDRTSDRATGRMPDALGEQRWFRTASYPCRSFSRRSRVEHGGFLDQVSDGVAPTPLPLK